MSRPRHGNRRTANRIDRVVRKKLSQEQETIRHMICASNEELAIGSYVHLFDANGKECTACVIAHANAEQYRTQQLTDERTVENINRVIAAKPFFYVMSFD